MDFTTFLWTTFAVFVTLSTFSFLYKDNPFYKIAEHLVVGTSAGYFVIILWHNGLVPNLFQRLQDGTWFYFWLDSSRPYYLIPAILGLLMWTRFSKKWSWISRWPMALYIGISAGVAIPLEMSARVNKQLFASMSKISWDNFWGIGSFDLLDPYSGLAQILIFTGSISALIYFFFSKEHKGWFGGIATYGIWILMIGFGASFGYTVMHRISLFIQRMQDIKVWGVTAFNASPTPNPAYDYKYQLVFWILILLVVAYTVREIYNFAKPKISK